MISHQYVFSYDWSTDIFVCYSNYIIYIDIVFEQYVFLYDFPKHLYFVIYKCKIRTHTLSFSFF